VAKTVLLANRAFPLRSRKPSRGNSGSISIPVPQDPVSTKFAATASTVSNSVDENSSLYAVENIIMMRENTYKIEPDDLFLTEKARGIIQEVLENRLKSKSLDAEESKNLSIEISEEIKRKVKAETPVNRYKLVCVVWIVQVLGQGVYHSITSRCLWNAQFDNFAEESYKNDHIFAQASVFAVFVE